MRWQAPAYGYDKINSDAAMKEERGTGIGVVIRDASGIAKAPTLMKEYILLTLKLAEVVAYRLEIQLAITMQLPNVVESDCLPLVQKLKCFFQ